LDLTRDLRELARLAGSDDAREDLLRRGLDWVARITPFDLATVFELDAGRLVVRAARGRLATPGVQHHHIPLERFPSVREALDTRRARAFTEADHAHGDGDPFDGVLDLPPGHACMVVPLCAGERCFGVLTLDRAKCETFPPQVVDLVEVYAQMLALALVHAEHRLALERLRSQDLEHARLLQSEHLGHEGVFEESVSPAMRDLARRARQVAQTETPVLVRGETGTGKERLARALHAWSRRAERPFVKLNCAALPAAMLQSELFGHVNGAFVGATQDRAGRFRTANGGTLLLDDVGELPLDLQAKLLRVLQDGEFEPVGSDRTVKVDVRIVAATPAPLEQAVARRQFREDLFHRLNVFPLHLPALRDRLDDLPRLCESLLNEMARRAGARPFRVTGEGLALLRSYHWPGNVRELGNVLERATILSPRATLGPDVLDVVPEGPSSLPSPRPGRSALKVPTLDDVQREHIRAVLLRTAGRVYGHGGAAELLGMKPSTLQSRMQKLGVPRFKP
jgi:transcriptional regulator with GAF, ATPase, and Fis domain